jgi:hypothetical protein
MTQIELGGHTFRGICRIVPELDGDGNPIEYMPQSYYDNVRNLPSETRMIILDESLLYFRLFRFLQPISTASISEIVFKLTTLFGEKTFASRVSESSHG